MLIALSYSSTCERRGIFGRRTQHPRLAHRHSTDCVAGVPYLVRCVDQILVDPILELLDLLDHARRHPKAEETLVHLAPECLVLHVGFPRAASLIVGMTHIVAKLDVLEAVQPPIRAAHHHVLALHDHVPAHRSLLRICGLRCHGTRQAGDGCPSSAQQRPHAEHCLGPISLLGSRAQAARAAPRRRPYRSLRDFA
eukprot:374752-Prymnesium_polylepis.1